MTETQTDNFVLVIDSLRTVEIGSTKNGTFILSVEDPHSVSIVEMTRDELSELEAEITRRLGHTDG